MPLHSEVSILWSLICVRYSWDGIYGWEWVSGDKSPLCLEVMVCGRPRSSLEVRLTFSMWQVLSWRNGIDGGRGENCCPWRGSGSPCLQEFRIWCCCWCCSLSPLVWTRAPAIQNSSLLSGLGAAGVPRGRSTSLVSSCSAGAGLC